MRRVHSTRPYRLINSLPSDLREVVSDLNFCMRSIFILSTLTISGSSESRGLREGHILSYMLAVVYMFCVINVDFIWTLLLCHECD